MDSCQKCVFFLSNVHCIDYDPGLLKLDHLHPNTVDILRLTADGKIAPNFDTIGCLMLLVFIFFSGDFEVLEAANHVKL